MRTFKSRGGVTLIETLVAVAMTSLVLSGSVLSLRQMEWSARRNHEYLVADSIAWDVIWKAYNSPRWSSAIAGTNSMLRTGWNAGLQEQKRGETVGSLPGFRILQRQGDDRGTKAEVKLVTMPDGSLETTVSWKDLRPLVSGNGLDGEDTRRRRLTMKRPRTFDRFWRRVEIDRLQGDE